MSYYTNFNDLRRQSADYVDKIFKGAKETPNKVGGGGGLATEAYLLTAACLEAV